jgi:hypothetical protein
VSDCQAPALSGISKWKRQHCASKLAKEWLAVWIASQEMFEMEYDNPWLIESH